MDIEKDLNSLFNLGQLYWQQADSEYVSQHRKSDETFQKATAKIDSIKNAFALLIRRKIDLEAELDTLKKSEQELRMQYISDFGQEQQCYEENAKLKAELEAIKKQEKFGYFLPGNGGNVFTQSKDNVRIAERFNWPVISLYADPVYQHSFTVDGHTFYADNEVDILYLERKFGVGGKAKLEVVKDER